VLRYCNNREVSSEDDVAKLFYQSYAHMRVYMAGKCRQDKIRKNWKNRNVVVEMRFADCCEANGNGRQKESNAASRKNASLTGKMVTTKEPKSRYLTARACRFTGCSGWTTESSCLASRQYSEGTCS
jgi:hypothetical protein